MKTRRQETRIWHKSWWWGELTPGRNAPTIRGFVVLFWGIAVPAYVLALALMG